VNGDQKVVENRGVARTTSGRLCNLSSYREGSALVGDEPPDGVTSLKEGTVGDFERFVGSFCTH
jgi:hypothetical protein